MSCEHLPLLNDVEVTGSHVEKVARMIQGGAGGSSATQWQDFLSCYGGHSERLGDTMAELVRFMANSVLDWNKI